MRTSPSVQEDFIKSRDAGENILSQRTARTGSEFKIEISLGIGQLRGPVLERRERENRDSGSQAE